MALVDTLLVSPAGPRSAYMWPETSPGRGRAGDPEIFVFQYWPDQLTDTENPRYAEKEVPSASHPLYQWTGGSGREISFTAVFTAEVDDESVAGIASNPAGSAILPSARYTVDINAAIARLKTFIRGKYSMGSINQATKPPPRLRLVFEGTQLGGTEESVLVILKSAPVTYESWFPSGRPRVASVQLTFNEVIQRADESGKSQIVYLGRSSFEAPAKRYRYRGTVDRVSG